MALFCNQSDFSKLVSMDQRCNEECKPSYNLVYFIEAEVGEAVFF